jgi:hypothetical protein
MSGRSAFAAPLRHREGEISEKGLAALQEGERVGVGVQFQDDAERGFAPLAQACASLRPDVFDVIRDFRSTTRLRLTGTE